MTDSDMERDQEVANPSGAKIPKIYLQDLAEKPVKILTLPTFSPQKAVDVKVAVEKRARGSTREREREWLRAAHKMGDGENDGAERERE